MKKGQDCGGSAFNAPEVLCPGTVTPKSGSSDIADPATMSFNYFYLEDAASTTSLMWAATIPRRENASRTRQ